MGNERVVNKRIVYKRYEQKKPRKRKIPSIQGSGPKFKKLTKEFSVDLNSQLSEHSQVYKGIRKSGALGNEDIAIKMLALNKREDAKPLLKEAEAIRQFENRNIVKYIFADFCTKNFLCIFLALELCFVDNLHMCITKLKDSSRRFSRPDCMSVLKQLANGLKYIHEKGILHRDLKPSNVLFSLDRKTLKIADFSLVKPMVPNRSVTANSSKRIGTDGWRAPEVLLRNCHCPESDVFSFGLLSYFVWSNGEHAFGNDYDLTNFNIKNNRNRNLLKILFPDSTVPNELLEKMLSYQPNERITASEIFDHQLCRDARDELENPDGCPLSTVANLPQPEPIDNTPQPEVVIFDKKSALMNAYVPSSGTWRHMQTLSEDIISWDMTVVLLGKYIYTLLQNRRVYCIKYNDKNAYWEQKNDLLLDHGALPSAAVLDGRIYVIGGSQWGTETIKEGEKYNPEDQDGTWSRIADMRMNRKVHSVAACNGRIYSIGGWDKATFEPNEEREAAVARGEKYDPTTNTWIDIQEMNRIRYATAAVTLDNRIYVLGGWREGNRLTEVEYYDTVAENWTVVTMMNIRRSFFNAVSLNGKIYAIDGDDISPQTIEEYDPGKDEWKVIEEMDNMHIWCKGSVSVVLQPHPPAELVLEPPE